MTDADVAIIRAADFAAISAAAASLRAGRLVAFPTETVYGLGADATNGRAVAAIFAAKGRPHFNPLIVHVKDVVQASVFAMFSPLTQQLAQAFWPGPLTLVLPRRDDCRLTHLVSAGLDTVAVRMPSHPVAARLIAEAGVPLAAPSANPSGRVSATCAAHVEEGLGGKVDMILDGGPTPLGIESTVIGFEHDRPVLLRPGAVLREALETITGPLASPAQGAMSSPGRLASHYAPRASLRLNVQEAAADESLLAFGPNVPCARRMLNLSPSGDLREAAANLFAMLRALDTEGDAIAVMPIPADGLGEAINDRLMRAAASRGDTP
ncbi:MAG: threonylcarbamoyl-AMP synthase [Alphaproteobacteria bacterium]|nr:threonylcarbamoyl-AMP synthase [Alphaproteobacteria bacterium]MDE2630829.1 threonylcarbamoyl-AMP synthase [Alphaproteobacteria bacterium]